MIDSIVPVKHNAKEAKSQQDIAYVAPYVIEGDDGIDRVDTHEIVVTYVLVATVVKELQINWK